MSYPYLSTLYHSKHKQILSFKILISYLHFTERKTLMYVGHSIGNTKRDKNRENILGNAPFMVTKARVNNIM